ncbi:response regulator [Psychrobacillus sp. NPDC096623]|uniref:response regulator n=1 Tax=Psychrobacillus sp. NPDC096623 TaxID=3364492 RepID=UPI00380C1D0B
MKRSILIVDDSRFMRSILKRQINQAWFTVIAEATNGEETIKQYKKYGPNIVLMDLTMPKMTGIEA